MAKGNYTDNVLIKLKRRYSKDETVQALTKKLREVEIENGKLKSELDELNYKYENRAKLKEKLNKEIAKEIKREDMYRQQRAVILELRHRLRSAK